MLNIGTLLLTTDPSMKLVCAGILPRCWWLVTGMDADYWRLLQLWQNEDYSIHWHFYSMQCHQTACLLTVELFPYWDQSSEILLLLYLVSPCTMLYSLYYNNRNEINNVLPLETIKKRVYLLKLVDINIKKKLFVQNTIKQIAV